jgi:hypothetical protein
VGVPTMDREVKPAVSVTVADTVEVFKKKGVPVF